MAVSISPRLAVSEGRFARVLILFMLLGFASLVAAGLGAAWVTRENESHTSWVGHTYRVENALGETRRALEEGEAVRRGVLLAPRFVRFFPTYRDVSATVPRLIGQVARLTRDNPRQQAAVARLRPLIAGQLGRERGSFALIAAGKVDAARRDFLSELDDKRMRVIRDELRAMAAEEQRLLVVRDADQRASARRFYAVLAVAGVLLLLVAIVSLLVVLRFAHDLTASRDKLRTFNDTLEDQVSTRTADLSRANEEIQRFAYIVSHDLRSPLVNVMGFTAELETAARPLGELVDRVEVDAPRLLTLDAKEAARVDLPESIAFIRTATAKMDRLINAILRLSREGRRVITPEPLDMDALAGGIRDSLSHQLERDGTAFSLAAPLPSVVSDRVAVEQILSNLIENAAKYLQPGRPGRITVSGEQLGDRIVYAVADNGRGIAPADHTRVFDLFRRSGAQDKPGEGIGLAHVRALAYRLGGSVDMTSELGQGATFRLSLPAVYGT